MSRGTFDEWRGCAERRRAAKCVGLRATEVIDHHAGIYEIRVSGFPSLDWTWEGSVALRPQDFDDEDDDDVNSLWKGDVVGVEPDQSALYVSMAPDSRHPPCKGTFLVKPFDFLAVLAELLSANDLKGCRGDLSSYLANSSQLQPGRTRNGASPAAIPESVWRSSWGAVWGPPGTGKTYTIGQLVAEAAGGGRILIVSTTNKATDSAALQVGRALRARGADSRTAIRLGAGADYELYEREGLTDLVSGTETELRRQLAKVRRQARSTSDPVEKARLTALKAELQRQLSEAGGLFEGGDKAIVLCTAYGAMARLVSKNVRDSIAAGMAPFTTAILDEAGLLSAAVTASLALLASKRVLLVGDPRQLAPISRMSRILPPEEARWLGSSGLSNLSDLRGAPNLHQLTVQYRMRPSIRKVVSAYQYEGSLTDDPRVVDRADPRGEKFAKLPRCIWYVLDDDTESQSAQIRAGRGPGNRSWIRPRTRAILEKLLKAMPTMAQSQGLFITPFAAQARQIRRFFGEAGHSTWTASTVHAQQGAEADWVIFDTVHASSTGWPFDEWKRLINVALSRSREQVILLASRSEMQEPYLSPLATLMTPGHFKRKWKKSERWVTHEASFDARRDPRSLGAQIERRKALRPVLSGEQERLCAYKMDGKPRLVRGVAGSGKTFVLANWLTQTVGSPDFKGKAWVVFANAALRSLLEATAREAWEEQRRTEPFPIKRVEFLHIRHVLDDLCRSGRIRPPSQDRFNYDAIAKLYLDRIGREGVRPRCDALFIDEAQDFGHHALELCFALVRSEEQSPDAKAAMVFYDNAQDVYGRGTPVWAQLGLNVQGRSTVMKESFRSTRPINEFAMNVLFRLQDPQGDADHRELVRRGLVEKQTRDGKPWWRIHFNRVDGPHPTFRKFPDRDREMDAMAAQVETWIVKEGLSPRDIKVLCNSKLIRNRTVQALETRLGRHRVRVVHETSTTFSDQDDTLVVSTAHSFKGYESEAVVVPGADKFSVKTADPLSSALYVAMTRARSLLYISALDRQGTGSARAIVDALAETDGILRGRQPTETIALSGPAANEEMFAKLPAEHRSWAEELGESHALQFEPLLRDDGSILAEPEFWFQAQGETFAAFIEPPPSAIAYDLEDAGVTVLRPGDSVPA